eukprot:scaffold843_cov327-Prasinococcus_capsulatus_cf.AAC.14
MQALFGTVTKTDDLVDPILANQLTLYPELEAFDARAAVFKDGRRQEFDIVVFADGYKPTRKFLQLPPAVTPVAPEGMYLRVFHPNMENTLAFVGFARPQIGSIPTICELQARLLALVFTDQVQLPDDVRMRQRIERARTQSRARFGAGSYASNLVEWFPYMDSLAAAVGCRPNGWQLLRRPLLLAKVLSGTTSRTAREPLRAGRRR